MNKYDNLMTLEDVYRGLPEDCRCFDIHVDLQHREVRVRINKPDAPYFERIRVMYLVRYMFHGIGWSVREWLETEHAHRLHPINPIAYKKVS